LPKEEFEMRRAFVISVMACSVALAPAALFAQDAPAAAPPPPKVTFETPAGMLLVAIKPDQTAAFEEMVGKIKAGLGKTEDAALKQQASSFKVFKGVTAADRVMYVVIADPVVPKAEYDLFMLLQRVLTKEELSNQEAIKTMWEKYRNAFVTGYNIWTLTPVGG
jgi:hypothetical protein